MANEWISVKDRLPEAPGKYLVCYDYDYMDILEYFASPDDLEYEEDYDGPGFYDYQDVIEYGELCGYCAFKPYGITHWMPLPEPPKGE